MVRRIVALVLSLLIVLLAGCSAQQRTHEDLSFALPADFEDRSAEAYAADFDFLYENGTIAISGIRETRQALHAYFGNVDAQRYARLVIELNEIEGEPVQKDGIWCFSYEAVSGGVPMTYLCAIYETEESLWQVQAYCATADLDAQQDTMWKLICSMQAQ